MTKHYLNQLLIIITSSVVLACAAPDERSASSADGGESRGRDCISQSSIRDYQVLDESNLIVTGGAKRKYHVKLKRRAFGLRSTWKIGFRSPTGLICSGGGELIVEDGFGSMERIHISSIRELKEDDVHELLVRFGKKVPEMEQTPAREEIKGAEVEELD